MRHHRVADEEQHHAQQGPASRTAQALEHEDDDDAADHEDFRRPDGNVENKARIMDGDPTADAEPDKAETKIEPGNPFVRGAAPVARVEGDADRQPEDQGEKLLGVEGEAKILRRRKRPGDAERRYQRRLRGYRRFEQTVARLETRRRVQSGRRSGRVVARDAFPRHALGGH